MFNGVIKPRGPPSANGPTSNQRQRAPTSKAPQSRPNYAIVRLSEGTDVLHFYQLLLENGYPEVSFVNEVRENAFLPFPGGGAGSAAGKMVMVQQQHQGQQHHQQQQNYINGGGGGGMMMVMGTGAEKKASSIGASVVAIAPAPSSSSGSHQRQKSHSRRHVSPQLATTNIISNSSRASAAGPPLFNGGHLSSSAYIQQHRPQQQVQAVSAVLSNGNVVAVPSPASSASSATPAAATTTTTTKSEEYAECLLCHNRIMSTRLSNLTNHVRRHATLKQYRCVSCSYAHNEMAKVRLHMGHNHADYTSQPVDTLNFEMQLQWGLLMEQCFPDHAKRFGPSAANSQFRNLEELQKYVEMERPYTCIECGEVLPGYRLVNHLDDMHRDECIPFACGQCGYQSSTQWKVRLHISVKHPERATETTVASLPSGSNYMLFLQKFFAEVHIPGEEDESKLVAELQEKNSDRLLAAMSALTGDEEEGEGTRQQGLTMVNSNGSNSNDLLLKLAPTPSPMAEEEEVEEEEEEMRDGMMEEEEGERMMAMMMMREQRKDIMMKKKKRNDGDETAEESNGTNEEQQERAEKICRKRDSSVASAAVEGEDGEENAQPATKKRQSHRLTEKRMSNVAATMGTRRK